jgi:hypothetical protein
VTPNKDVDISLYTYKSIEQYEGSKIAAMKLFSAVKYDIHDFNYFQMKIFPYLNDFFCFI